VADTPAATDATALEDAQTTGGLVLSRSTDDGAEVTYFQIGGITGGALFLSDGTTPIANGDFITVAQGQAGLRFTPASDSVADGCFTVRASTSAAASGLGGGCVTATITVTPVNDAPRFTAGATQIVSEDSGTHTVVGWAAGLSAGPDDESGQALTFEVTGNTNPALFAPGGAPVIAATGELSYTLAANAAGSAQLTLVLHDDGGTANGGLDTTASQEFKIVANNVNDAPTAALVGGEVNEGSSGQVSFSGQADIDDGDAAAGFTYSYDFNNDGAFEVEDGPTALATVPATFLADGPADLTVRATITDQHGASSEYTATIAIKNVAPLADAGGTYTGSEGDTIALSAAASNDPGQDVLSYAWDLDGDGDFDDATGVSATFSAAANGSYTVRVRVTDKDGASSEAAASVVIGNVAPAVSAGASATLAENETFTRAGSFTDPGSTSWTATVDYGDGAGAQPLTIAADKTFSLNHTYADNGSYTVVVHVDDGANASQATVLVAVTNVAPSGALASDGGVDEGSAGSVSFSAADPSPADTAAGLRYSYDFDNDGAFEVTDSPSATASVPAAYLADGPQARVVRGRVSD
jgi:hypothetical protein